MIGYFYELQSASLNLPFRLDLDVMVMPIHIGLIMSSSTVRGVEYS